VVSLIDSLFLKKKEEKTLYQNTDDQCMSMVAFCFMKKGSDCLGLKSIILALPDNGILIFLNSQDVMRAFKMQYAIFLQMERKGVNSISHRILVIRFFGYTIK